MKYTQHVVDTFKAAVTSGEAMESGFEPVQREGLLDCIECSSTHWTIKYDPILSCYRYCVSYPDRLVYKFLSALHSMDELGDSQPIEDLEAECEAFEAEVGLNLIPGFDSNWDEDMQEHFSYRTNC